MRKKCDIYCIALASVASSKKEESQIKIKASVNYLRIWWRVTRAVDESARVVGKFNFIRRFMNEYRALKIQWCRVWIMKKYTRRFNLQMNGQSEKCIRERKRERENENSGHSPRIKFSCNNNNCRAIAFMRRPQAPIFMSTFHAH